MGRNKNELLVLTGAAYTFVAYLIAFTLEVLFLIRYINSELEDDRISSLPPPSSSPISSLSSTSSTTTTTTAPTFAPTIAISAPATIAILYFIIFIASLILITALILHSTFMLLIWMCAMTTMYLPEFGLVVYVSVYSWSIETRNGQVELIFYIIRALLNLLFIYKTYKLFKEWSYEKSFLRLNTGGGYDSPYFIGDSLSTTINPMFSASMYSRDNTMAPSSGVTSLSSKLKANYGFEQSPYSTNSRSGFYLGDGDLYSRQMDGFRDHDRRTRFSPTSRPYAKPATSLWSINDQFDEFKLDLDYRTLSHNQQQQQQHNNHHHLQHIDLHNHPHQQQQQHHHHLARPSSRQNHHHHNHHNQVHQYQASPDGVGYSTQSLDRRSLKEFGGLPEQVVLRPLGHQPFEYLNRPGSTSNLNSLSNLDTQPSMYSSNSKLTRRADYDGHHRF